MLYRSLKEMSVSILGFGAMRLPLVGGTRCRPTLLTRHGPSMRKRRRE